LLSSNAVCSAPARSCNFVPTTGADDNEDVVLPTATALSSLSSNAADARLTPARRTDGDSPGLLHSSGDRGEGARVAAAAPDNGCAAASNALLATTSAF
jgi:hypothetical protein